MVKEKISLRVNFSTSEGTCNRPGGPRTKTPKYGSPKKKKKKKEKEEKRRELSGRK